MEIGKWAEKPGVNLREILLVDVKYIFLFRKFDCQEEFKVRNCIGVITKWIHTALIKGEQKKSTQPFFRLEPIS